MRIIQYILLISLFFASINYSFAQKNTYTINGLVTDGISGEAIEFVTVYIEGSNIATETNSSGIFEFKVPANKDHTIVFTRIGYKPLAKNIAPAESGSLRSLDILLVPADSDLEVVVKESVVKEGGMIREEVEQLKLLPTTTGNFESVLPHIALGTSGGTGGELSSQYNVRGGNYDENLVYVNDFEIYRPQLISTGQQEGLSFPNIDLIRDLSFSSGGFDAKYGDKLSSVLDIKYKRPEEFRASIGFSLLGASGHIEGSKSIDEYRRFRYLVGARYKTTNYLLNSLDVKGEYTPQFADLQGYFSYDLSRDWQLGLLINYNQAIYNFIPQESSSAFGLIDNALRLSTVFEGGEQDEFTTAMGGLSLTYLPDREANPYYLKFLLSDYRSQENESFDILGFYRLAQIETNLGSDDIGDEVFLLGAGTQHEFTRNFLVTNVAHFQHKGGIEFNNFNTDDSKEVSHFIQWGIGAKHEYIYDKINEWERLDSAGYSLPFDPFAVHLERSLKTQNELASLRFSAYVQDSWIKMIPDKSEMKFTAGLRAQHWTLNGETLISPRMQFLYKPLGEDKKDISYRFAAGYYQQAAFYREMRNIDGFVNTNLGAQKSLHFVGGLTLDFIGKSKTKYRLIMEAYYKSLWDLVSYEVDNVRIRYSGQNDSKGYAAGFDIRLNGEFVPGVESWVNLGFLRTRESLYGVTHMRRDLGDPEARVVRDVARPTDRLYTLSVFFQDYFPRNENFKAHLNLSLGSGLPFGLQDNNEIFRNTYRYRPYQRVDIGFSYLLWNEERKATRPNHFLSFTRNSWVSLEVLNILDIRNEASNTWIKSVFNVQYAIPNYLTGRRINLRFKFDF